MSVGEFSVSGNKGKTPEQIDRIAADLARFYGAFLETPESEIFLDIHPGYTTPKGIKGELWNGLYDRVFLFWRENGKIVGVAQFRSGKSILVEMVSVLEPAQRKKIGLKLYTAVQAYARKHGIKHVNADFVSESGARLGKKVLETKRYRYSGFKNMGLAATHSPSSHSTRGKKTKTTPPFFIYTKVKIPQRKVRRRK